MRRMIQIILTTEEYDMLKAVKTMTGKDDSECVVDAIEFWLRKLTKEVKVPSVCSEHCSVDRGSACCKGCEYEYYKED